MACNAVLARKAARTKNPQAGQGSVMIELVPAILTDSVDDLRQKLQTLESFTESVHIDMCDGVYVPTRTLSLQEVLAVPTTLRIEFHLMTANPSFVLAEYLATSAERVLVHADSELDIHSMLCSFTAEKMRLGIAFRQSDCGAAGWLKRWQGIDRSVAQATFVTVPPGQQHQTLLPDVLEQAKLFHARYPFLPLEIDGGVHRDTIETAVLSHPERIILGSALWRADDPKAAYEEMVERAQSVPR